MKNILLCTDCSENAKKAIDQCLMLFKSQPINYFLLYTYNVEEADYSALVARNDTLKLQVNNCLEAEMNRIKKLPFANNVSITARSVYGKTENVVKRFIAKSNVDLVVVGNQGNNYKMSQLFGSTTKKILYDTDTPKLLVPNHIFDSVSNKKVVIVQEPNLNNFEWWSNVTTISKLQNLSFQLIVLPSKESGRSSISIPNFIKKDISEITDFTNVSTTEINQLIENMVQLEKPRLLHLNLKDQQLAKQLLRENQPSRSIYNNIPFFVQPFSF